MKIHFYVLMLILLSGFVLGYSRIDNNNLLATYPEGWINGSESCPNGSVIDHSTYIELYSSSNSSCDSPIQYTLPYNITSSERSEIEFTYRRVTDTLSGAFVVKFSQTKDNQPSVNDCGIAYVYTTLNQPPVTYWDRFRYGPGDTQANATATTSQPLTWQKIRMVINPGSAANSSQPYAEFWRNNVLASNVSLAGCGSGSDLYLSIGQDHGATALGTLQTYIANVSLDGYTSASVDCPGKPAAPIYAADTFDYFKSTGSCWWYPTPIISVYPTTGALCYDGADNSQTFTFLTSGQGNFYGYDVFTEEFNINLENGAFFEKTLTYVVLSGGERLAYMVDFYTDGNGTIQYYSVDNMTYSLNSLCSNCWKIGMNNQIKITTYGADALGYTALNSTASSFQAIQPNTWAIKINDGPLYFNIPILEISEDDSNIPSEAGFSIDGANMCLYDYTLFSGLIQTPGEAPNTSGIPYKQINEPCSAAWECYTGNCHLGQCQKKGYKVTCLNNFECISNKCIGGQCAKPSLSEGLDAGKDYVVGDDMASSTILSIVISLITAGAVVILGASVGIGGTIAFIGGGAIFSIMLVVFTIMGWLSPFVLIAYFILLAVIMFLIFFKGG